MDIAWVIEERSKSLLFYSECWFVIRKTSTTLVNYVWSSIFASCLWVQDGGTNNAEENARASVDWNPFKSRVNRKKNIESESENKWWKEKRRLEYRKV